MTTVNLSINLSNISNIRWCDTGLWIPPTDYNTFGLALLNMCLLIFLYKLWNVIDDEHRQEGFNFKNFSKFTDEQKMKWLFDKGLLYLAGVNFILVVFQILLMTGLFEVLALL